MRSALFYSTLLIFVIGSTISTFAQENKFELHLDSLKSQDKLETWIIDRLDYVAANPISRFSYLMQTQKMLWRNPKTYDEHYIFLDLLNNQGYYQLLEGNILGSISSYELAYRYYLKHQISSYEIVEYTLKPLSNNYTRLRDYEKALYLQQLSINFLIKTNDSPEKIASLYSNLAISYRAMGKLTAAEQSVKTGLKLANSNTSVYFLLNNILADILIDQQNPQMAAKLMEINISKQKRINANNAYQFMGAYTTAGLAYLKMQNTAKATLYLDKALAIIYTYFKNERVREQANIFTLKGNVKLIQHQPLLAIENFKKTLITLKVTNADGYPIVSKIYGDNRLVEVFEQMADAYLILNQPKEAFHYIKLALFSADKIRNEYVDDQTKELLQADLKQITEKAINLAYQQYLQTKDKNLLNSILELAEQSKARTLFDQIRRNQQAIQTNNKDSLFTKKQELERAIIYNNKQELALKARAKNKNTDSLKFYLSLIDKQIKQKYKQFNFDRELNILKLLSKLPKVRTIEYFVGKDAIFIIDIKNGEISQVVKLDQSAQIKSQVNFFTNQYFQHGPNAMLSAPKDFYTASNQLYQQLLHRINLSKGEKVVIIPDEFLGYISFDGLIKDRIYKTNIAKWPFLIKYHTFTYAFSLQTLALEQPVNTIKEFTGLFITHQQNRNKPLRAVQDEANSIKKIVRGSFLFNDEVNTTTFNSAFEKSTVLHIGTHAYLSGKNLEPTLDFDKERLFLFELGAKKNAPSLVVLSACRTADGLLTNGEGIISLSRGFNAIGTSATIAGLWNVNDVASAVITSSLYTHILNGKSSGDALHLAKLDWLNTSQTSDALYLPYYWDSLILMGTDQQLKLSPVINWKLGIGIVIGLFFLIPSYFLLRKKFKKQ